MIYSIVDLHALTMPQDPAVLREWRRQAFAVLLAVGLRPERAVLFFQSAVGFILLFQDIARMVEGWKVDVTGVMV